MPSTSAQRATTRRSRSNFRPPYTSCVLSSFCAVFYFILFLFYFYFYFYFFIFFQDYCRAGRSARRYIPGEALLLRGRRPHLVQYLLSMIGEAAEEYYRKNGAKNTNNNTNNNNNNNKIIRRSPVHKFVCPFVSSS